MSNTTRMRVALASAAVFGAAIMFPFSANADRLFSDGFELGTLSYAENGVRWAGGNKSSVTSEVVRTGSYSLKLNFPGAPLGADASAEQRFSLGKDYTEVHAEWYAYYAAAPTNYTARYLHRTDAGANNNKFFRLWKGDTSDGNGGYTKFYLKVGASTEPEPSGDSSLYGEYGTDALGVGIRGPSGAGASGGKAASVINDTVRGRWVKFAYHAKASSAQGVNDGIIEVFRDDQVLFSARNLLLYSSTGPSAFNSGYFLGWANSGFSETTAIYIDDVVISTSPPIVRSVPKAPDPVTVQ